MITHYRTQNIANSFLRAHARNSFANLYLTGQLASGHEFNIRVHNYYIPTSTDILIGPANGTGDMHSDNINFWNQALSQQEIQQYMICPPTGNEAGLVGYWNFEEGPGSTVVLDQTVNKIFLN